MAEIKSLFLNFILISFLFQFSLTQDDPTLSPAQPYETSFSDITSEQYITLKLNKPDESIYYLHFSTSPSTPQSSDLQQIIFSSKTEKPIINETEEYSFKFSRKANLIIPDPKKEDNTTYITIRCLKYPCSFNFKASMEQNTPILTLDETHNFYGYSTNTIGKDKMNKVKFYIPTMKNLGKNLMNVAVINPGDIDGSYNKLIYKEGSIEKEITKIYKINNGVIYAVEEQEKYNNYFLEIESIENQFVIISIKTSNVKDGNIETDITPNTISKYSYIYKSPFNECFKINEDYYKNFIKDSQKNDLLYASINFFTYPMKVYLKYSDSQTDVQNDDKKTSLNVLLNSNLSEGFPKICFEQDSKVKLEDNAFMIEINHMYQNMDNIDIASPIFSGFFNPKTLLKNTLGIYTHYSDIHFIEKISYYLKPTKGKPIMYFVQCDDYPNCVSNYGDLQKDSQNVFKAEDFGDFQFYTKEYDPKTKQKDLAPYSYSQNLLYVYCPEDSVDGYCQFEILVYSDYEEIVIHENEDFNAVMKKEERHMYKMEFKKGHNNIENIDFCVNVTENDITFEALEETNNVNVTKVKKKNLNCYKYELKKDYHNLEKKDIAIVFNIIAKKDVNYKLTNIKEIIIPSEIGKVIKVNDFSFPYSLYYLINNTESDFLLNVYLGDKNQKLNLANVQIGYILLSEADLTKIIESGKKEISDKAIKETIDPATKTSSISITKDYIKKVIGTDTDNSYYLYIVFVTDNKVTNDESKIEAKIYLVEKEKNNFYPLEKSNFISDNLILDTSDIFKAYLIKMEKNGLLEIKFSSNYPLDDSFSVYVVEYKADVDINIDYLEKNKKELETYSIGQMHTITYDNSKSVDSDIIFAVVSKKKKDEIALDKINYMFKYELFKSKDEYNKQPKYDFNQNYTLTEENNKHVFEFDPVKKSGANLNPEIYIRKVTLENKIANETFDTYAKIESKYEILKGDKTDKDGKVRITTNKITEKNCTFSIILDIPDENEKFVVSNLVEKKSSPDGKPTDDKGSDSPDGDSSLIIKIAIPIACVVVVIIIVLIVITLRKRKSSDIKGGFQGDSEGLLKDEIN